MKPIIRLLIAIALAVLLCQLSYVMFTKTVAKYEVHNTERLHELLLNNTPYDLIFLGSSRTHMDVNPRIIDSICGLRSYNAGVNGANLFEFEMIFKAYLENHPAPRYIVLNFDVHSFSNSSQIYNYPAYFPYTANKVINQYLTANGYLNTPKKIFPFLRIFDFDDDAKGDFLKSLVGKTDIMPGDFQYHGFISNTDVTMHNEAPIEKHYQEIMPDKKQALERIILTCREKNIRLIFAYFPEYKRQYEQSLTNLPEFFSTVDSFATANNIRFIRDDSLEINDNPLMFANVNHLNKEGAQQYSVILAKELQSELGLPAR